MFPVIQGKWKHAVRAVPSPMHGLVVLVRKHALGQAQVRLHKYTVQ